MKLIFFTLSLILILPDEGAVVFSLELPLVLRPVSLTIVPPVPEVATEAEVAGASVLAFFLSDSSPSLLSGAGLFSPLPTGSFLEVSLLPVK